MGNAEMPHAGIDSALERAYTDRDRLTDAERRRIITVYTSSGPHRDRTKSAAMYSEMARIGVTPAPSLVNEGEMYRTWRAYAAAESLNRAALRYDSVNAVALLNIVQLQLDRGHADSATATVA